MCACVHVCVTHSLRCFILAFKILGVEAAVLINMIGYGYEFDGVVALFGTLRRWEGLALLAEYLMVTFSRGWLSAKSRGC